MTGWEWNKVKWNQIPKAGHRQIKGKEDTKITFEPKTNKNSLRGKIGHFNFEKCDKSSCPLFPREEFLLVLSSNVIFVSSFPVIHMCPTYIFYSFYPSLLPSLLYEIPSDSQYSNSYKWNVKKKIKNKPNTRRKKQRCFSDETMKTNDSGDNTM